MQYGIREREQDLITDLGLPNDPRGLDSPISKMLVLHSTAMIMRCFPRRMQDAFRREEKGPLE
jgi:hypothetical protein